MDPQDLKILISYKDLEQLMKAVDEIPKMRQEVKRYQEQVVSLKGLYSQLLERVGELMKLI